MESTTHATTLSPARRWTARIIVTIVVLFLVFDGVTKVMMVPQVAEASARLGLRTGVTQGIGVLLLALTGVYVIPWTSIFGAVLLTGYLGGATAINVRAGDPLFETVFPIVFCVLVWAPVYIRNERLRSLIPIRRA